MKNPKNLKTKGFTLLEVIISLAIGSLILAGLSATFWFQRQRYDVQEEYKEMSYTARAAMDIISRDVASAGYSPSGLLQNEVYPEKPVTDSTPLVDFVGIPYKTDILEIISDLNGDGDIGDEKEWIRYRYNSALKQIQRAIKPDDPTAFTGTIDAHEWLPFAENINAFTFTYFKENGNPVTSTSDQEFIRNVKLSMTATAEKTHVNISQANQYTSLLSEVKIRNMGLKKPAPSTTSSTTAPFGETTTLTVVPSTVLPPGFIEEEVVMTTVPPDPNTTTVPPPETLVETTTVHAPTDCIVKLAVGTCITANNNGDVLMRVHVLDYVTLEPVEGAVVNWAVKDLNVSPSVTYEYDELYPWGDGWYGGSYACSCAEANVPVGCASSNPYDLKSEPDFKRGYFDVIIEVSLEGCGGGILVIPAESIL